LPKRDFGLVLIVMLGGIVSHRIILELEKRKMFGFAKVEE